ncbi:MAG: transcription-repair coupling factor [Acholeplasmatales bacterium]|jgi:transcription-repair coupling factor (superfamily II helicase)|nr:transcription-repair coupling factor [Acholeplasmataceae bacterium]MDY0115144.1 transcription-repair coupling factor [Acholeplasmatales bacterium]MCK9289663.1 transcription-repair coupling factor [Acholeplasmataceae bacterium]MCK9427472.1 transcription-repair coupling factor [Acholeplasmataceae bacterium]MDD4090087.1 transcription-repair coupling factor [Acholeplasmataceae bacterium]
MSKLNNYYQQLNIFKPLEELKEEKVISAFSLSYLSLYLKEQFLKGDQTIFVVLPNLALTEKLYDLLFNLLPEDVLFYPEDEFLTSLLNLSLEAFKIERIATIKELLKEEKKIVVLNDVAAFKKVSAKKSFKKAFITLKEGDDIDLNQLIKSLVDNGYKREYTVLNQGEFSMRGSIVDIYPFSSNEPYRLDLFDTLIETIKVFNASTQISRGRVSMLEVMPAVELIFSDEGKNEALKTIEADLESSSSSLKTKALINEEIDKLYNRVELDNLRQYVSYFPHSSLFDFKDKKIIYYYEKEKMLINFQRMEEDLNNYKKDNPLYSLKEFYYQPEKLLELPHYELDPFYNGDKELKVASRDVISYQGRDDLFIDEVIKEKKTAIITFKNEIRYQKMISYLESKKFKFFLNPNKITKDSINLIYPEESLSFELYNRNIIFIDEAYLYDYKPHLRAVNYRSSLKEVVKIDSIEELKVGDYVVHYDCGIGVYKGIKTMSLSHDKRDYMHIQYQGTDYLYVPVDQLDLVLKYSSREGVMPKLTKLGTNQWKKTKRNIKAKLTDLSDRLFKLYQEREQQVGFEFLKAEKMHEEFASDFPYEETLDQQKVINEVILDMESSKVMDRLIIGDVGYGKTEVALRAAFKAVYSNKQVAYLVPTTLLARQHYLLFNERFSKFGITVKLLSRFVSKKEITKTLSNLKKGLVDIVVGTHRLLSSDVVYKDLGLLIIDEEQRFGVLHKEKIKEIKVNVDTLSLTATPIPRTLQMGLTGIKDLSMIETPPKNRYPIQTYILERYDAIIKEAILKEVARGGQVFYLYNRVDDIDKIVFKLTSLIPELKIAVAHGQMTKARLENVMSAFISGEFDVLVSTTIIETGIDIPNANTLIVHDADRLGLAQLYQIRGRVGRSNKLAYSYLFYDKRKKLTKEAQQRLKTIKDFESLGSGFKIAMRDLAIRGAGDILGKEQSGFIDSVGLEMYLKMLEEVISEKKGIITPPRLDDEVLLSKRYIDKEYISHDEVRLAIHQRIGAVNNLNDINNLIIELEDRFGKFDESLYDYMYEKLLTKYLERLRVEKVLKTQTDLTLILPIVVTERVKGDILFTSLAETNFKIKLSYIDKRLQIALVYEEDKNPLLAMITYLDLVIKNGAFSGIVKST